MANEEPEKDKELGASLVVPGAQAAPAAGEAPLPPGMTAQEAQELRARAAEIVAQLAEASGSREMEMVDSVTAVGMQAQRQAAGQLDLLRAQVGDLLSGEGAGAQVTRDLVALRVALNEINPSELSKSPLRRILSILPFYKRLMNVLETIAVRYEEVSKQVVVVERRLRDGQMMLRRDNIELRKLYEQVEAQQLPVKRNAFLGELLMQELDKAMARAVDQLKRDRLQSALFDVSMRVQDLRTMEEVHTQFFVSIEMTRENNTRLAQAVDRTLTLATNTLMVGLAIQSALARQKRVLEATRRTREFLGELITANAAAIRQHTTDIGDVYKDPVIAMDKLAQAHSDLLEALDIASRLKTEGIEAARENIAKLRQMTAELEQKAGGLPEQREAPSVEA